MDDDFKVVQMQFFIKVLCDEGRIKYNLLGGKVRFGGQSVMILFIFFFIGNVNSSFSDNDILEKDIFEFMKIVVVCFGGQV